MNKKAVLIVIGVIAILLAGYLYQTVPNEDEVYTVTMINQQGGEMGTVELSETRAGVLLRLNLSGLTPNGEHAFHIHEKGECVTSTKFKSAGGHYNPKGKSHGMKHPEGHHAGDMPNLKPDDEGKIETQVLNRNVTLSLESVDGRDTLFDDDRSAIVIHAGADDHVSQPSGAAGARIACGVIR